MRGAVALFVCKCLIIPAEGIPRSRTSYAPIIAPMPGRIVRVMAAAGEDLAARQPVVVVEAMKMENELRARAAGTVSEVRVTEGASVEAGAILVILA